MSLLDDEPIGAMPFCLVLLCYALLGWVIGLLLFANGILSPSTLIIYAPMRFCLLCYALLCCCVLFRKLSLLLCSFSLAVWMMSHSLWLYMSLWHFALWYCDVPWLWLSYTCSTVHWYVVVPLFICCMDEDPFPLNIHAPILFFLCRYVVSWLWVGYMWWWLKLSLYQPKLLLFRPFS